MTGVGPGFIAPEQFAHLLRVARPLAELTKK